MKLAGRLTLGARYSRGTLGTFAGVTGFTQGVSMSFDLKEPSKSISLGTFAGVGIYIVIYLTVAVVFAAVMPKEAKTEDDQLSFSMYQGLL